MNEATRTRIASAALATCALIDACLIAFVVRTANQANFYESMGASFVVAVTFALLLPSLIGTAAAARTFTRRTEMSVRKFTVWTCVITIFAVVPQSIWLAFWLSHLHCSPSFFGA